MEKVTAEMHVEIGRILAEMVDMIGKIHDEIVVEKIKMVVASPSTKKKLKKQKQQQGGRGEDDHDDSPQVADIYQFNRLQERDCVYAEIIRNLEKRYGDESF